MKLVIRDEAPGDFAAIDAIHLAAFADDPRSLRNEQAIVRALRASDRLSISLVAQLDAEAVGHLAVSAVSITDGATGWFGLGPVAVLPRHQGQGIGRRLIRESLQRLRDSGAAGCVVLGEPAYYASFGFRPASLLVLAGVPPQYLQSIAFAATMPQGAVAYHEAFGLPA